MVNTTTPAMLGKRTAATEGRHDEDRVSRADHSLLSAIASELRARPTQTAAGIVARFRGMLAPHTDGATWVLHVVGDRVHIVRAHPGLEGVVLAVQRRRVLVTDVYATGDATRCTLVGRASSGERVILHASLAPPRIHVAHRAGVRAEVSVPPWMLERGLMAECEPTADAPLLPDTSSWTTLCVHGVRCGAVRKAWLEQCDLAVEAARGPELDAALALGIMGPRWVSLPAGTSDTRYMRVVDGDASVPLSVVAFDIECLSSRGPAAFPQASCRGDMVIQIGWARALVDPGGGSAGALQRGVMCVGSCDAIADVDVRSFDDEASLLRAFLSWLVDLAQPDVLVGFHSHQFDMPYVLERARMLGVDVRAFDDGFRPPDGDRFVFAPRLIGAAHIDVLVEARRSLTLPRYSLDAVAFHVLGEHKDTGVPYENIPTLQAGTAADRARLAAYCVRDTELTMRLALEMRLVPQLWRRSLALRVPMAVLAGRPPSSWVQAMLARACREHRMFVPVAQAGWQGVDWRAVLGAVVPRVGRHVGSFAEVDVGALAATLLAGDDTVPPVVASIIAQIIAADEGPWALRAAFDAFGGSEYAKVPLRAVVDAAVAHVEQWVRAHASAVLQFDGRTLVVAAGDGGAVPCAGRRFDGPLLVLDDRRRVFLQGGVAVARGLVLGGSHDACVLVRRVAAECAEHVLRQGDMSRAKLAVRAAVGRLWAGLAPGGDLVETLRGDGESSAVVGVEAAPGSKRVSFVPAATVGAKPHRAYYADALRRAVQPLLCGAMADGEFDAPPPPPPGAAGTRSMWQFVG